MVPNSDNSEKSEKVGISNKITDITPGDGACGYYSLALGVIYAVKKSYLDGASYDIPDELVKAFYDLFPDKLQSIQESAQIYDSLSDAQKKDCKNKLQEMILKTTVGRGDDLSRDRKKSKLVHVLSRVVALCISREDQSGYQDDNGLPLDYPLLPIEFKVPLTLDDDGMPPLWLHGDQFWLDANLFLSLKTRWGLSDYVQLSKRSKSVLDKNVLDNKKPVAQDNGSSEADSLMAIAAQESIESFQQKYNFSVEQWNILFSPPLDQITQKDKGKLIIYYRGDHFSPMEAEGDDQGKLTELFAPVSELISQNTIDQKEAPVLDEYPSVLNITSSQSKTNPNPEESTSESDSTTVFHSTVHDHLDITSTNDSDSRHANKDLWEEYVKVIEQYATDDKIHNLEIKKDEFKASYALSGEDGALQTTSLSGSKFTVSPLISGQYKGIDAVCEAMKKPEKSNIEVTIHYTFTLDKVGDFCKHGYTSSESKV